MGAIVVSNLVFGVIGFTISGCLVRVERFKHLTIVAVGVWLAGLVNVVFMGFPIGQWVAGIFLAFLMMGIGGAVSFLFVSAERQAQLMRCPFCAEEIRVEARVCKHCGREVAGARSAPTEPA